MFYLFLYIRNRKDIRKFYIHLDQIRLYLVIIIQSKFIDRCIRIN